MKNLTNDKIRQSVRKKYGDLAKADGAGCGCADSSCCDSGAKQKVEGVSVNIGYTNEDVSSVPEGADMGLGCGNPQAIASLKSGETVLDLGSGGGFDCFLAARTVGKTGRVIGVDMTPEMISKARENAEKVDLSNVEFRLGEIENLPVADSSVDVIISNCVINLSPDKPQVYKEAFRILKSGGRIAISDVVATAEIPANVKEDINFYSSCVSGAEHVDTLKSILKEIGFVQISIKLKEGSRELISSWAPGKKFEDFIASATIEALKPVCRQAGNPV